MKYIIFLSTCIAAGGLGYVCGQVFGFQGLLFSVPAGLLIGMFGAVLAEAV